MQTQIFKKSAWNSDYFKVEMQLKKIKRHVSVQEDTNEKAIKGRNSTLNLSRLIGISNTTFKDFYKR